MFLDVDSKIFIPEHLPCHHFEKEALNSSILCDFPTRLHDFENSLKLMSDFVQLSKYFLF